MASATFAVWPEHMTVPAAQPEDGSLNQIKAEMSQRIFSGANTTCLITWNGQSFKVAGRDQDMANLPETGPVWLSWNTGKTIVIGK